MCTVVSRGQIWGARKEALSGLEGLLEVVGLELMTESITIGTHWYTAAGREFQILWAATLKLRSPNEVRTHGAESKLVLERLKERVEW